MPSISFKQCSSSNYTSGRGGKSIQYIVIHYTATSASAYNNVVYFSRAGAGASAHYFNDGGDTIWQSVADSDTAWHAGNWWYNQRSIGIETVSAGEDFSAAEISNLTWLVQKLMKEYSIPASHVIRHYDITGKKCPAPYISSSKWNTLHAQITGGTVSDTSSSSSSSSSNSSSSSSSTNSASTDTWKTGDALDVDGWLGPKSVKNWQSQLGTTVDGVVSSQPNSVKKYLQRCPSGTWVFTSSASGSQMVKALQAKVGTTQDGSCGPATVKALQTWLNSNCGASLSVDGYLGSATAKAVQTALNSNYFKTKAASTTTITTTTTTTVDLGDDLRIWGPKFTKAMQTQLGTTVDGIVSSQSTSSKKYLTNCSTSSWKFVSGATGSQMVKALQKKVGSDQDGFCGPNTVKALQTWLNNNRSAGLAVDGYMGAATCRAVASALQAQAFK